MNSSHMDLDSCATCGYSFNMVSSIHGKGKPEEGDFTICLNCGELLVYDAELKTGLAPEGWEKRFPPEVLLEVRTAVRLIRTRGRIHPGGAPDA